MAILGQGIINAIDLTTSIVLLALLDLIAKNLFIMWLWSAAAWMRRIERRSAEMLHLVGASPAAAQPAQRTRIESRQMLGGDLFTAKD